MIHSRAEDAGGGADQKCGVSLRDSAAAATDVLNYAIYWGPDFYE
jgi:hypothetical protein